jgi:hypothetical protein
MRKLAVQQAQTWNGDATVGEARPDRIMQHTPFDDNRLLRCSLNGRQTSKTEKYRPNRDRSNSIRACNIIECAEVTIRRDQRQRGAKTHKPPLAAPIAASTVLVVRSWIHDAVGRPSIKNRTGPRHVSESLSTA